MKIDSTKIVGYENLTEEQKALLETIEFDEKSFVDKKTFDKTASELAEAKKKLTTTKSEGEEKNIQLQNELQELRTKVGQMEKEKTIATHTAKYIALGYDEKLAKDTATAMVEGEFEKVFANQRTFLNAHDNETKTTLLQGTPAPVGTQTGTNTFTLDKLRQMSPAERYKFSVEHPDEYNQLYGGK